jgi:hypothetical protein
VFRFLDTDDPDELAELWRRASSLDESVEILPQQSVLLLRDAPRGRSDAHVREPEAHRRSCSKTAARMSK